MIDYQRVAGPGPEGELAETASRFPEARSPDTPRIVVGALRVLGLMMILAAGSSAWAGEQHRMLNLSIVCYALVGLGWIIVAWRPQSGSWNSGRMLPPLSGRPQIDQASWTAFATPAIIAFRVAGRGWDYTD